MRLLTAAQARELDQRADEESSGRIERLMESAGERVFSFIEHLSKSNSTIHKNSTITILCGPGNNGGDGFVVARLLKLAGYKNLQVFAPLGGETSQLFQLNLERLRSKDVVVESLGKWLQQKSNTNLIIDALFGTGLSRPLGGVFLDCIKKANGSVGALRIAIDVPSGLDSDRGNVLGEGFLADYTVTFTSPKPGFFINEGPSHVGKLCVKSIGFNEGWVRDSGDSHFLITRKFVEKYFPSRDHRSNKSKHGKLLVVAGHDGMWGAGVLASRAGYRAGSGYVTLASFEDPTHVLSEIPEVLSCHLTASTKLPPHTAAVVGPGLGVSDLVQRLIDKLKLTKEKSVLLDADALSVLAQYSFGKLPMNWVLTPHAGELSRIIDMTSEQIEEDRFAAVEMAVKKWGCVVLLKGFHTVIGIPTKHKVKKLVIPTGNEALAKAGTGDVLAGFIAGLMAQGVSSWKAAAMGAYLHGLCADVWVKRKSKQSLTASDLLHLLPEVLP